MNGRAEAVAEFLREETTGGKLLLAATGVALLWANAAERLLPGGLGCERRGRARLAAPRPDARRVGIRRAAGDLLLRRRDGDQARADRRRAGRPAGRLAAAVRRGRRHGRAGAGRPGAVRRCRGRRRRLGDPRRDRHRLRARRARARGRGAPIGRARAAAGDRRDRRPARHRADRDHLHRGPRAGVAGRGVAAGALYWVALRHRRRPRLDPLDRSPWRLDLRTRERRPRHRRRDRPRPAHAGPAARRGAATPSERFEHRLHPVSAGIAVPIFALAAAGIPLAAAGDALDDSDRASASSAVCWSARSSASSAARAWPSASGSARCPIEVALGATSCPWRCSARSATPSAC